MTTYRVGHKQPQNIYRDDEYIGVMFNPEDAALIVEALNNAERENCISCAKGRPDCGHTEELPDDLTYEEQYSERP